MEGQAILWLVAALALLGFCLFIWKKTSMTAYLSPVKRELKKEKQWLRRGEYNAAMVKGRQNLELFLKLVAEFNGIRLDNTAQAQACAKNGQDLRYMNGRPARGHRGQMVMTHQQFGKWLDARGYLDRVGRWELNEIRLIGNKAVHENYSSKEDAWNQYNYMVDLLKIVSEKHPVRQKKRGPELEREGQNRKPEQEKERQNRRPEKKRTGGQPQERKNDRRTERKPERRTERNAEKKDAGRPQGGRKEKTVKAEISVAVQKAPRAAKVSQAKTAKPGQSAKPNQAAGIKSGQSVKSSQPVKSGQPAKASQAAGIKSGQPAKTSQAAKPNPAKAAKPVRTAAAKGSQPKAASPVPAPVSGENAPQKLSASAKRRQRRKRAKAAAAAAARETEGMPNGQRAGQNTGKTE